MNLFNILSEIEKVDPEIYDRLDSRRKVFKHFAGFGKKLAATAVPLAFGSMLNKAYGQTNNTVQDTLVFAYILEKLEAEFYRLANAAVAPMANVPAIAKTALNVIGTHENQHVTFLESVITIAKPTFTAASFDWTAMGNLPATAFADYPTILAVAQALEDTGVRAYKGQAANLVTNSTVLQAALQIHSVEARHAAHIRRMRRDGMNVNQKPWITGSDRGGLPAFTAPVYEGVATTNPTATATSEANTTHAGINIASVPSSGPTISANAATEAFDEPLNKNEVIAIAKLFVISLR